MPFWQALALFINATPPEVYIVSFGFDRSLLNPRSNLLQFGYLATPAVTRHGVATEGSWRVTLTVERCECGLGSS